MDELLIRPLLTAHLQDAVVPAYGFAQLLAFVDGESHRFFQVYVFACAAGRHGDQGVVMVRCGDHHRIDVGPGENILVIFIGLDFRLDSFRSIVFSNAAVETFPFDVVNIRSRYDAYAVDRQEAVQQIHGLLSQSDEAEADRIARCGFAFCGSCDGGVTAQ